MLNLLIAIISGTFQRVTENNRLANNVEKAQIVSEIDETLSAKDRQGLTLKKYLCVVYSKEGEAKEQDQNEEILSRIEGLEAKVEEIASALRQKTN